MSLITSLPPPPSTSSPPSSGAPPGAPPGAPAFESALAEQWARTANAEGQQESPQAGGEEAQPKHPGAGEPEVPASAEAMAAAFIPAAGAGEPSINEPQPPAGGGQPHSATNPAQAGPQANPAATVTEDAPAAPGESGHRLESQLEPGPAAQRSQPSTTGSPDAQPGTELPSQGAPAKLASGEESAVVAAGRPVEPPAVSKTASAPGPPSTDRSAQGTPPAQQAAGEPRASAAQADGPHSTAATVASGGALSQPRAQSAAPEGSSSGPGDSGAEAPASNPTHAIASSAEASTTAGLEIAGPTQTTTLAPSPGLATQTVARVPMQEVIDAIRATIEIAARQGSAQARIALQPEELGHISIHLSQTSEGLLARVTADTPAAAQALAGARSELHQSLSSLGATLLRLDIGSSDARDRDSRFAGDPQAASTAKASADSEGPESAVAAGEIDGATQPRGVPRGELLDVFA